MKRIVKQPFLTFEQFREIVSSLGEAWEVHSGYQAPGYQASQNYYGISLEIFYFDEEWKVSGPGGWSYLQSPEGTFTMEALQALVRVNVGHWIKHLDVKIKGLQETRNELTNLVQP